MGVASESVGVGLEDSRTKEVFTQVSDLHNLNNLNVYIIRFYHKLCSLSPLYLFALSHTHTHTHTMLQSEADRKIFRVIFETSQLAYDKVDNFIAK